MKRTLTMLILISLLAGALAIPAFAGEPEPIEPLTPPPVVDGGGEIVDETPQFWFVEMPSKPTANGTSKAKVRQEKTNFRAQAKRAKLQFTERYAFDTLWNGLSIAIDPSDVGRLASLDTVKAVYPVTTIPIPEGTLSGSPELFTAIQMTGADIAQSELGYTGAGVKVAVMDTGVDYDHSDLGGDGVARENSDVFPTARVVAGWDFVGDDFNADDTDPSYNPVTTPDPYPDDCESHGTHVAGIVGANGDVTGVAPDVMFGSYRVFGCEGSTFSDIMVAAMEMALKDKMDVLNMSIGSSFQWPQYPTAQAADRLVQKGMVVVASIGNSGSSGVYSASAPGVGEKVIGVASFDNTNAMLPYFEVEGTKIGYINMDFAAPLPVSGTEEMVFVGRGCDGDPYEADPDGKVALIIRGACSFRVKALNAQAAGATAAVVFNNGPGNFNGTLSAPFVDFPVGSIAGEDGDFIVTLEPVDVTWKDQLFSFPSPTGGLISSFSSYGLAPDLSLKPDIGAPGGNIFSTIPVEQGGYDIKGGTSMSSPHVAGAAALLLQAKPKTKAGDVRAILQNSADPHPWWGWPTGPFLDNVHRQGAGMLDIDDAILATTSITPGKIAAGESEAGPYMTTLSVKNDGSEAVTYDLSYVSAIATTGTWADDLGFWLTDEVINFSTNSLTVPAGKTKKVDVAIEGPTSPDLGVYGGYIVFTPQGGGQVYRVPYAGFVGDYQALSVLDANPFGLPWLWESADGDLTYTLEGGDVPEFWVNFAHQSDNVSFAIYKAGSGRPVHPIFNKFVDIDYMGRNANYDFIYSFVWDGTRIHSNGANGRGYTKFMTKRVPDGDYVIEIQVLKALGDADNPDHWEAWTSPVITIDRP